MQIKGLKINFLGDSITEGCGTSDVSKRFTDLIESKYGAICRNYGIGGTRIAKQIHPSSDPIFDKDFLSRVEGMDADADVVVIFGGTNDYGHGDAPIGRFTDREETTFYGALHSLYSKIITRFPGALIIVLTPLHRCTEDDTRGDCNKPIASGTLKEYVNVIREVAEYYSIPVLDLYATGGMQPNVPAIKEKYVPDGLHPNDAGHEILCEKIAHFIMAI